MDVRTSVVQIVDVSHQNKYTVQNLQGTTTFYLVVTNSTNGSSIVVQRWLQIIVQAVAVELQVDAPFVGLGQTFTISWISKGADACTLYSPFAPSGETMPPNGSKTYQVGTDQQSPISFTIHASNNKLGVTAQDQLIVMIESPIIDSFEASCGTTPVEAGSAVTLRWKTRFALTCSLDRGIGTVDCNGETVVHLHHTGTITLTCQGYQQPAIQTVTIHMIPVRILSFEVKPSAVTPKTRSLAEVPTLSWKTDHALTAWISCPTDPSGNSQVSLPEGSRVVNPSQDATYTLTCWGHDGPVTAQVYLKVFHGPF
jgi:hypothetical protein